MIVKGIELFAESVNQILIVAFGLMPQLRRPTLVLASWVVSSACRTIVARCLIALTYTLIALTYTLSNTALARQIMPSQQDREETKQFRAQKRWQVADELYVNLPLGVSSSMCETPTRSET